MPTARREHTKAGLFSRESEEADQPCDFFLGHCSSSTSWALFQTVQKPRVKVLVVRLTWNKLSVMDVPVVTWFRVTGNDWASQVMHVPLCSAPGDPAVGRQGRA